MRCDVCGSSDSIFFVKPDGAGGELHVCRACAVIKGYAQAGEGLGARLDSFFSEEDSCSGPCPQCAWSAGGLASTGQLGCTQCAKVFRRETMVLRKRAGASGCYEGKVARASRAGACDSGTKAELAVSLENALRTEDFEAAARIRDSLMSDDTRNKL